MWDRNDVISEHFEKHLFPFEFPFFRANSFKIKQNECISVSYSVTIQTLRRSIKLQWRASHAAAVTTVDQSRCLLLSAQHSKGHTHAGASLVVIVRCTAAAPHAERWRLPVCVVSPSQQGLPLSVSVPVSVSVVVLLLIALSTVHIANEHSLQQTTVNNNARKARNHKRKSKNENKNSEHTVPEG